MPVFMRYPDHFVTLYLYPGEVFTAIHRFACFTVKQVFLRPRSAYFAY